MRFCRLLAGAGRFAIRYDHRDTGRSVTYEPGRPGLHGRRTSSPTPPRLLDAYGIPAAHLVGLSAGRRRSRSCSRAPLRRYPSSEQIAVTTRSPTRPHQHLARRRPAAGRSRRPTQAFGRVGFSTARTDRTHADIRRIDYHVDYCARARRRRASRSTRPRSREAPAAATSSAPATSQVGAQPRAACPTAPARAGRCPRSRRPPS